jgi:hypothetical protein
MDSHGNVLIAVLYHRVRGIHNMYTEESTLEALRDEPLLDTVIFHPTDDAQRDSQFARTVLSEARNVHYFFMDRLKLTPSMISKLISAAEEDCFHEFVLSMRSAPATIANYMEATEAMGRCSNKYIALKGGDYDPLHPTCQMYDFMYDAEPFMRTLTYLSDPFFPQNTVEPKGCRQESPWRLNTPISDNNNNA